MFPEPPFPFNLDLVLQYHAFAYTEDEAYNFTGDTSGNDETAYNGLNWLDMRTQPSYATIFALRDEAYSAMAGYLVTTSYVDDHAQIAINTGAITALNTSVSALNAAMSDAQDAIEAQAITMAGAITDAATDASTSASASSVTILGISVPTQTSYAALVTSYNDLATKYNALAGKVNTLFSHLRTQGLQDS